MTLVDGPAVGERSSPCLPFSVTLVDGPAVGESSSPWLPFSVTLVDGPAVGESSSPWLPFSVTLVDGPAVGESSSPWLPFSVTLVDGPAVGESSSPWLPFSVTLVDGPAVGERSSVLRDLKHVLSRGCILCVLRGGNVTMWMPCDRAYSMTANVLWLLWPSVTIICGAICELGEMFQPLHKQAASVQPFGLA